MVCSRLYIKLHSVLYYIILVNKTCKYFYTDEDNYNIPFLIPLIVMYMSQLISFGLEKKKYLYSSFFSNYENNFSRLSTKTWIQEIC